MAAARRAYRLVVGAVLIATASCATHLGSRAAAIRWVDAPGEVKGCQYLGIVEGSSSQSGVANSDVGEANARHEALEQAANEGATHVMWRPFSYGMLIRATGDAYVCADSNAWASSDPDEASDNDGGSSPLEQSCTDGDGQSCFTLAKKLLAGDAPKADEDVEAAVRYLALACSDRVLDACLAAATLFDSSNSPDKRARAGRFYRAACKLGSQSACDTASGFATADADVQEKEVHPEPDEVPKKEEYYGIGTCFAVSGDGLVVTANHVVDGATAIGVQFADEDLLIAQVVKSSSALDVALLRVERETKDFVRVVPDAEPELGDGIFTIGFPQPIELGFEPKYAEGTVSALSVDGQDNMMQMSIPIHQGNSGGAVVSENGTLLGVVVARVNDDAFYARTGAIAGDITFAVKMSFAAPLVPKKYRASKLRKLTRKKAIALVEHATCKVLTLTEK